jgi:hypothetical protein
MLPAFENASEGSFGWTLHPAYEQVFFFRVSFFFNFLASPRRFKYLKGTA